MESPDSDSESVTSSDSSDDDLIDQEAASDGGDGCCDLASAIVAHMKACGTMFRGQTRSQAALYGQIGLAKRNSKRPSPI